METKEFWEGKRRRGEKKLPPCVFPQDNKWGPNLENDFTLQKKEPNDIIQVEESSILHVVCIQFLRHQ